MQTNFLLFLLLCVLLPVQIYCQVTCGSVVKLKHKATGARLHSHQVNYATGSGQQSVTGFPSFDIHFFDEIYLIF